MDGVDYKNVPSSFPYNTRIIAMARALIEGRRLIEEIRY